MGYRSWLKTLGLGALATAGVIAVGAQTALQPIPAMAQLNRTCQGFTLFGGVDSEYRLAYCIDNNERRDTRARYYLRVAGRVVTRDVIELEIAYPEAFEEAGGHFDNATIEIREGTGRGGAVIPAETFIEANLDEADSAEIGGIQTDSNVLTIILEQPIPANSSFVVVISDVRNPNRFGIHNFSLDLMYQGDAFAQFVGIWALDVAAE